MMFEAMLWGRPVYCDTKNHGLYFICNHTDDWADRLAPLDFLNYYVFVYTAPMDIATTDEYIRWRLTEPSMDEIYHRHLTHYLSRYGVTEEELYTQTDEEFICTMARAKGADGSCVPLEDLPTDGSVWQMMLDDLHYDIGQYARERETAEEKDARLASTTEQLRHSQEALADADSRLEQTRLEGDLLRGELEAAHARLAQVQHEASRLLEELGTTKEQLEAAGIQLEETGAQLMQVEQDRSKLQEMNDELTAQLQGILTSHTWTATAPLRGAMDAIKGALAGRE